MSDRTSATLIEDCPLFYVTAAEVFQADDCGANLQMSVDLVRVDCLRTSIGNHRTATTLISANERLRHAHADLSPPLVV